MPVSNINGTLIVHEEYTADSDNNTFLVAQTGPDGVVRGSGGAPFTPSSGVNSDTSNADTWGKFSRVIVKCDLTALPASADYTKLVLKMKLAGINKWQSPELEPPVGNRVNNMAIIRAGDGYDYSASPVGQTNWDAQTSALGGTEYASSPLRVEDAEVGNFYYWTAESAALPLTFPTLVLCVYVGYEFSGVDPFTDFDASVDFLSPEWGGRWQETDINVELTYTITEQDVTPTLVDGTSRRTIFTPSVAENFSPTPTICERSHTIFTPSIISSFPIAIPNIVTRAHTIFTPSVEGPRGQSILVRSHTIFTELVVTRQARIVNSTIVLPDIINLRFDDVNFPVPMTLQLVGSEPIDLSTGVAGIFFDVYDIPGTLIATAECQITNPVNGEIKLIYNQLVGTGEYLADVRIEWESGEATLCPSGFQILRLRAHGGRTAAVSSPNLAAEYPFLPNFRNRHTT